MSNPNAPKEDDVEFVFPDETPEAKGAAAAPAAPAEEDTPVEVVDDTPPEDRNRVPFETPPNDPTEDELKSYRPEVRTRIQQLTKARHDERREKERIAREHAEAIRVAQAALSENQRLRGTLQEGTKALHAQTSAALEAEIAAASQELKEAYESFDGEALTKAQRRLNTAQIKAAQLENFVPPPSQAPENVVQTQQVAQQPAVDPKARAWLSRNQWWGQNRKMTSFAFGLHEELVAQGLDPRGDDYYARIDRELRQRFPEEFPGETQGTPQRTAKANVVAPASRSTAPQKIVLTKSSVALANKLGIPLKEYARQVALLERTDK